MKGVQAMKGGSKWERRSKRAEQSKAHTAEVATESELIK